MRHLAWTSWKTAALLAVITSGASAQDAPTVPATPGSEKIAPVIERAYLGVYVEGPAEAGGLQLAEIVAGSPAAKAGLQAGDVIVALGDTTVGSEEELRAAIGALGVGSKVKITFLRDGEKRRTSARLAAAPEEMKSEEIGEIAEGDAEVVELVDISEGGKAGFIDIEGLNGLGDLAPAASSDSGWMGVQLQSTDDGQSAVLDGIDGSPAQAAGLEAGDVIELFDGEEVGSVDQLVELVRARKAGDVVKLRVRRGDKVVKPKITLGVRNDGVALPGMGGGMGATSGEMAPVRVRVAPTPPPAAEPPAAPVRARARIAAAREAAAREQALRAEHAAKQAAEQAEHQQHHDHAQTIAELERQVDELRRRCEEQERTLQRIREALGGGGGGGGGRGREPSIEFSGLGDGTVSFAPAIVTFDSSDGSNPLQLLPSGAVAMNGGQGSFSLAPATIALDGEGAQRTVERMMLDGQDLRLRLEGGGEMAPSTMTVEGIELTFEGEDGCTVAGQCNTTATAAAECTATTDCGDAAPATAECCAESCDVQLDGGGSFTVVGDVDDVGTVPRFVVDGAAGEGIARAIVLRDGQQLHIVRAPGGGDGSGPNKATIVVKKGAGHSHGDAPKMKQGQRIELKQEKRIAPKQAVASKRAVAGLKLPAAHAGERYADGRCSDCQARCCQKGGDELPAEFGRGGAPPGRAPTALRWRIAPPAPQAAPRLRWRMLQSGHPHGVWSTEPPKNGPAKIRVRGVKAPANHQGNFELQMLPAVLDGDEGALLLELPCEIECQGAAACPAASEECVIECTVDGAAMECPTVIGSCPAAGESCEVQCETQCEVECEVLYEIDGGGAK